MDTYLSKMRDWKNRNFKDWLWDLLVGAFLAAVAVGVLYFTLLLKVPFDCSLVVLAIPFSFTVWNQFLNKIFEPKDFLLRMAVPGIVYIITLF